MQGSGFLHIYDYDVLFKGSGALVVSPGLQAASLAVAGRGYLYANGTTDHGRGTFPAIAGQGFSDGLAGYGFGFGMFPPMTGGGEGSAYVPAVAQFGVGIFPPLSGAGVMIASSSGEASASFPSFLGRGGEDGYGGGYGTFPVLMGSGMDDFMPGQAMVGEMVIALDGVLGIMEHIVFISNAASVEGTFSGTREQVAEILASLSANSTYTLLGEFVAGSFSVASASSHVPATVGNSPSLPQGGRVWVVNLDTGASSQYDNYGFHSFFERDGEYFGVAEDGIYRLDGETDNGRDINASVETGISDYGSRHVKRLRRVYAGATSDGKLLLKLEADGVSRIYEAVSHDDTAMTVHRFNIQRKDIGHYLNFTLRNQDGDDFDLEKIDFTYINLSRRF